MPTSINLLDEGRVDREIDRSHDEGSWRTDI